MTARAQKSILITGFEPFATGASTAPINPSWEIARRLPDTIGAHRVIRLKVPVEFGASIAKVAKKMASLRPTHVFMLGQAGGRSHISVERVAINLSDASQPDNVGAAPIDEPVAIDGPAAYFATLPVKAMVAAMRARGFPAEVSHTAGTYVCNHLMYGVLHAIAESHATTKAGFIHVPYLPSQVAHVRGVASMSLGDMSQAIEIAINAALRQQRPAARDAIMGGATH
jgi:pyroglutamyl-peptidase